MNPFPSANPATIDLPQTDVTIVIPIYDEAASIGKVVERCLEAVESLPLSART